MFDLMAASASQGTFTPLYTDGIQNVGWIGTGRFLDDKIYMFPTDTIEVRYNRIDMSKYSKIELDMSIIDTPAKIGVKFAVPGEFVAIQWMEVLEKNRTTFQLDIPNLKGLGTIKIYSSEWFSGGTFIYAIRLY